MLREGPTEQNEEPLLLPPPLRSSRISRHRLHGLRTLHTVRYILEHRNVPGIRIAPQCSASARRRGGNKIGGSLSEGKRKDPGSGVRARVCPTGRQFGEARELQAEQIESAHSPRYSGLEALSSGFHAFLLTQSTLVRLVSGGRRGARTRRRVGACQAERDHLSDASDVVGPASASAGWASQERRPLANVPRA